MAPQRPPECNLLTARLAKLSRRISAFASPRSACAPSLHPQRRQMTCGCPTRSRASIYRESATETLDPSWSPFSGDTICNSAQVSCTSLCSALLAALCAASRAQIDLSSHLRRRTCLSRPICHRQHTKLSLLRQRSYICEQLDFAALTSMRKTHRENMLFVCIWTGHCAGV